jgi:triacylglycerol lipase
MFDDDKRIYLEEIAPPYLKYTYFRHADEYPFQFRPETIGKFDLVNAWWLCEASILSYANKDFVAEKFENVNLSEVEFFSGPSTQCYVACNNDFLILVFRGTEIKPRQGETSFIKVISAILVDIQADIHVTPVNFDASGRNGRVHKGFKAALDEVWEKKGLFDYLKSKEKPGRTFWFTGHSLGAALATLAWKKYCNTGTIPGLYTYGSPRVGDNDFGNGFQEKTFRLVNNDDIVTRVPLEGIYHHVGCLKFINADGIIEENSNNAAGDSDAKTKIRSLLDFHRGSGNFIATLQEEILKISPFFHLRKVNLAGSDILFPGALLDHVPTLYSSWIIKNILS